jgi:hypothetical protein
MDTKNTFDSNSEEVDPKLTQNLKGFGAKPVPQKPLSEKSSPGQKKNNNNIQMSYYFPNNSNLDGSEKDAEFATNINVSLI